MAQLTDDDRRSIVEVLEELTDRVAAHTGVAIEALEGVEEGYDGWRDKGRERGDESGEAAYYFAATDLQRAQVHASLALGLRLDALVTLLSVFALPEFVASFVPEGGPPRE